MEILIVIGFCWLLFKGLGLIFKVAWCSAKVAATVLLAVAVPLLAVILIFAGGLLLLIPLGLLGIAFALLKGCV